MEKCNTKLKIKVTNCSYFESSLGTEHYAFYFKMGTKVFLVTQSY